MGAAAAALLNSLQADQDRWDAKMLTLKITSRPCSASADEQKAHDFCTTEVQDEGEVDEENGEHLGKFGNFESSEGFQLGLGDFGASQRAAEVGEHVGEEVEEEENAGRGGREEEEEEDIETRLRRLQAMEIEEESDDDSDDDVHEGRGGSREKEGNEKAAEESQQHEDARGNDLLGAAQRIEDTPASSSKDLPTPSKGPVEESLIAAALRIAGVEADTPEGAFEELLRRAKNLPQTDVDGPILEEDYDNEELAIGIAPAKGSRTSSKSSKAANWAAERLRRKRSGLAARTPTGSRAQTPVQA